MLHHAIVKHDTATIHGIGLVATERIEAGTVVWQRDDTMRAMTRAEAAELSPDQLAEFHWFAFQSGADEYLLLDGIDRYMNHSCDANTWWLNDTTMTARRTIEAGEEVTYDYATTEIGDTFELTCTCGAATCRGVVTHLDHLNPTWQAIYIDHVPSHVQQSIIQNHHM